MRILHYETPIYTVNDGWKQIQELNIGDKVFNSIGEQTAITHVKKINDSWGVKFKYSNDDTITHSLFSKHRVAGLEERYVFKKTGTKFSFNHDIVHIVKNFMKGKSPQYSLYTPEPFELNISELPIDPYLLGCWLGDGYTRDGKVCGADLEVLQKIQETQYDDWIVNGNDFWEVRSLKFKSDLAKLGLIGRKSIPQMYLNALKTHRIAILRGIMDTDGFVSAKGHCELVLKDNGHELMDDILHLLRSLGIRVSQKHKSIKTATNGKRGNRTICNRIYFTPNRFNPFYLARKRLLAEPKVNQDGSKEIIFLKDFEIIDKMDSYFAVETWAKDDSILVGESFVPC